MINMRRDLYEGMQRAFDTQRELEKDKKREEDAAKEAKRDEAYKKGICTVCLVTRSNMVFLGCGHLAMCQACTEHRAFRRNGNKAKCPICRKENEMMRIHVP
jgi:rubrerythrin